VRPPEATAFKDQFYERYASTHLVHRKGEASLQSFRRSAASWAGHFKPLLPSDRNASIIDVGCGTGGLVWWLHQEGYGRAEGIDLSAELIEVARGLGITGVARADLRSHLSCHDGAYDVVILRDVLEHFPRDEILDILALVQGALRPGGSIIVQVPNAESPFFGRIRYGDFTHETAFSASSLIQVLQMTGYERIRLRPTSPVVQSLPSLVRVVLWKGVEALYRLLLFAELGRGRRIVTQGIIAAADRPPAAH
jgi:2-polyprenyl-3-methyl-5-hydroxy-6-metoxy-1,4-benzoquinol methylase